MTGEIGPRPPSFRDRGLFRRLKSAKDRVAGAVTAFTADRSGAVALYVGMVSALLIGAGAVVFDIGRVEIVKTQMQNAADAAALAAAVHLDGLDGARARAQVVAQNAASQQSLIDVGAVANGNSADIVVNSVDFYSAYTPSKVAATSDADAAFVEVTIAPRDVSLFMEPVLSLISGNPAQQSTHVVSTSVATTAPIICNAPPLMMCDPLESTPPINLALAANAGRQVNIKEGPGGVPGAPGEFGMLCLPDGDCGASALGKALAAVQQQKCMSADVETAPGSKTVQIQNGMNARFDLGNKNPHNPARDVIALPRDTDMTEMKFIGNGNWDRNGYWGAKHNGDPLPADLVGATRYQTYLYELGETYATNGGRTLYPAPAALPAGYSLVTPPAAAIPVAVNPSDSSDPDFDGVPQTAATPDARRRLVKIALLECQALGVAGNGTYPTKGRFLEAFVTEHVRNPAEPYGGRIMGEVVRIITNQNSEDFYANARLVE